MNPRHIDNITDPKRRAIAPYNFVELPEKVVEAELPLPEGDRYHLNRHTGRIECILTTESPLYTRCGWSPEDFVKYLEPTTHKTKEEREQWEKGEKAQWEKERKEILAPFFSYPYSKLPVISGSSIRGMLRTLVEIVSFSKIERVTDNKLFYRSIADQKNYTSNFIEVSRLPHPHHPSNMIPCYAPKVHAGFLRKRGNSYVIDECIYGRIDRKPTNRIIPNLPNNSNLPTKPLYQGSAPSKTPSWTYQHQTIYVDIEPSEKDHFFIRQTNRNGGQRHPNLYLRFRKVYSASFTPAPGLQKGTLVITGDIQHKHLEFVFLDEKLNEYPVDEKIIRRFQDDDQITKWQEKAYPKDKPSRGSREQDGYLRDGEPVFFLLNNDNTVRFFGRAQMFRLPYPYSPLDFVPEKLRDQSQTDIAEAIFGYVDGKKPRKEAYASRVFITDAILVDKNQIENAKKTQEKEATEILLSSPKPTTFQHYLVQPKETEAHPKKLKHYASQPPTDIEEGETVIRGHKLYWHKPYQNIEVTENADSQTSLVKPIDPGIKFKFDIRFENLSDVELGALLWVLSLSSDKSKQLVTGKKNEKYCFSLGMGKPLGMGAVKIDYNLHLSDRTSRYSNLFDGDQWKTGEENQAETAKREKECVKAFEDFMFDSEKGISDKDRERPDKTKATSFKETRRIEMLLAMLRCDPPSEITDYMKLEGFKDRKVLPNPLDIREIKDQRRFSTDSTPSSKTASKPKPQKKSDHPKQEPENKVNLATQRAPRPPKR